MMKLIMAMVVIIMTMVVMMIDVHVGDNKADYDHINRDLARL